MFTSALLIWAALLLFVSIWIVVPAPIYPLLAFGVVAPELSPLLLILAALTAAVGFRVRGSSRTLIVVMSLLTAMVAAIPLLQVRAAVRRFDAATASLPPPDTTHASSSSPTITRGFAFAEPGGLPLTLDLYRTSVEGLLPVVVQIYGGAWQRGGPGDNAAFASWLAQCGYLVVAIDYRHAPKWRWPAQIDDVREAIEWVSQHAGEYGGDADRVALLGRSSGAQLALVAGYTTPDRIRAIVSLYGPTDLAAGWRRPPSPDPLPVRPALETFLGGTPSSLPERYAAASPVTYVRKDVPPTLLIYGGRDHIVEERFGRELHERLLAAGASSIDLNLPWAEHAFDTVPGLSARVVAPYIERFLSAHLHDRTPPKAGPDTPQLKPDHPATAPPR